MFKLVKQHDVKINVWFEYRSQKGGIFHPLYVPRDIAQPRGLEGHTAEFESVCRKSITDCNR